MSITERYNTLYHEQHRLRQDFHEGLRFHPNAREASACTVDTASLGRNTVEVVTTATKAVLPWMAPIAAVSVVAQGILAGPLALSMVRDSVLQGKAALACGDTEGVAVNLAHGTMGSAYFGVAGLLSYQGIEVLRGVAPIGGAVLATACLGIALYGLLGVASLYNLKQASDFGKTLAAKKKEGPQAVLKWFEEQLTLSPEEANRKDAAQLLQKKWNVFELRTNPEIAKKVRHQLQQLLATPDHPKTVERTAKLIEEVEKANYKTRVKHKLLLLLTIVGLASMIAAIVLSGGLIVPILTAVGAALWLTVDSSRLHNYIGEKCWTWHRGEKPVVLKM